jgi:hypothetical protein
MHGPKVGFINWEIPSEGCFECEYLGRNDLACQNLPRIEDIDGDETIYCRNFKRKETKE